MLMFRRRLSRFAAGWLLYQLCVWTVTPTLICAEPKTAGDTACSCPHAEYAACPMHASRGKAEPVPCSCRGTTNGPAAVVAQLLGSAAVLAAPLVAAAPADCAQSLALGDARPIETLLVPVSPPPRA